MAHLLDRLQKEKNFYKIRRIVNIFVGGWLGTWHMVYMAYKLATCTLFSGDAFLKDITKMILWRTIETYHNYITCYSITVMSILGFTMFIC